MNYNTFLLRFGFNPADFKNKEATIVEGDDESIVYELEQEMSLMAIKSSKDFTLNRMPKRYPS